MTSPFPQIQAQASLLMAGLFLCLPAMAQVPSQWMFGTDSTSEQVYGMAMTNGGNILMAANEDVDSIGQSDIGIRRVSRSGALLSRKIIGSEWDDFVRGLEPAGENQFLLTGMRTAYSPFRQLATILLLDSLGTILWEWVHPDTSSTSEFKIARISENGNILACGNISSPGQKIRSLVMRFDENGQLMGEFTQQDTVNEISHAAWPLETGNWLITGDRQMPDLTYRPYLMEIDQHDSLVWRQFYDEQVNGGAQNLIGLSDGHFLLVGESYPSPGVFAFDIFLRKITDTGVTLWYQTYGAGGADAGFGVVESPQDHSLSLTGYYLNPLTNNTDAILIHTDSSGIELDRTWAGGAEIDYGNVIRLDHQDTIWIAGFSNSGLDSQGLLAKHSWNDPVLSLQAGVDHLVRPVPNPARPGQWISLYAEGHISSVRWRSIYGQALTKELLLFPGNRNIAAPSQAGMYLLEVTIHHKPSYIRILVTP